MLSSARMIVEAKKEPFDHSDRILYMLKMNRRTALHLLCLAMLLCSYATQSIAHNQLSKKRLFPVTGEALFSAEVYRESPNPFAQKIRKKAADNRRLIAACLAFPLPVGFLGAHRIFLGTNPYVPVAYAATLGGCLGAIPLIDFLTIVFSKNFEQYENNPRFFMWIKKKRKE
jgi:TM2 domain-containing membrane protein YozV